MSWIVTDTMGDEYFVFECEDEVEEFLEEDFDGDVDDLVVYRTDKEYEVEEGAKFTLREV